MSTWPCCEHRKPIDPGYHSEPCNKCHSPKVKPNGEVEVGGISRGWVRKGYMNTYDAWVYEDGGSRKVGWFPKRRQAVDEICRQTLRPV